MKKTILFNIMVAGLMLNSSAYARGRNANSGAPSSGNRPRAEKTDANLSATAQACLSELRTQVKALQEEVRTCYQDVLTTNSITFQGKTRTEIDSLLTDEIRTQLEACKSEFPARSDIQAEVAKCKSLSDGSTENNTPASPGESETTPSQNSSDPSSETSSSSL